MNGPTLRQKYIVRPERRVRRTMCDAPRSMVIGQGTLNDTSRPTGGDVRRTLSREMGVRESPHNVQRISVFANPTEAGRQKPLYLDPQVLIKNTRVGVHVLYTVGNVHEGIHGPR